MIILISTVLSISGVWSSRNIDPNRWEDIADSLASRGFDTVFFPCAYGPELDLDGLQACLEACMPRGIDVHAHVVMFRVDCTDDSLRNIVMVDSRMQTYSDSTVNHHWLNPSDPRNVSMMAGICQKIAGEFPVAGIHLDYVRWINGDAGYSDSSRTRFMEYAGIGRLDWPADVMPRGEYHSAFLDWRSSEITAAVEAVGDSLMKINRVVELSAAVMPEYEKMQECGQLWNKWLEQDLVDFVVPMNYTDSDSQLTAWGEEQTLLANGGRIYCGIGFRCSRFSLSVEDLIRQIQLADQLDYDGYVVFRVCDDLLSMVDRLPDWNAD
jgi:uncharacterized lipoprotein YddW (UPF0748 family)